MRRYRKMLWYCVLIWIGLWIVTPDAMVFATEAQGSLIVQMQQPGQKLTVTAMNTQNVWIQEADDCGIAEITNLPNGRYTVEMVTAGSLQMQTFTVEIPNENGDFVIHAYPKFAEVDPVYERPPATGDCMPEMERLCLKLLLILAAGCVSIVLKLNIYRKGR